MSSNFYDAKNEDYQICSFFSQSMTGVANVYIARHLPSNSLVALKKYDLDRLKGEEAQLIQDEVILMRQLNHPAVLKVLCSFVADQKVVCVLPLMGYGSAADVVLRHFPTGLPEQAIATILKSIVLALIYLHSRGIIHRAVRGSHILISAEGNVSLTGMRYSCPIISSGRWQKKVHSFPAFTMAPNMNWLSPELLQQNLEGYDEKSDVYSVGVTACELANGVVPYCGTPTTLMLIEKVKGIPRTLLDASTFIPNVPNDDEDNGSDRCREDDEYANIVSTRRFSNAFHAATELCLETERTNRMSAKELVNQPFFKSAAHPSSLPRVLKPAMPVLQDSLPENYDDMESIMACERMSNLEIDPVTWDF